MQLISILGLLALAYIYKMLNDLIETEDLAAIKTASLNMCSDGVLAHSLLYYVTHVRKDLETIRTSWFTIGCIGATHFANMFFFSIAFKKLRRSSFCVCISQICEPPQSEFRQRRTWSDGVIDFVKVGMLVRYCCKRCRRVDDGNDDAGSAYNEGNESVGRKEQTTNVSIESIAAQSMNFTDEENKD